MIAMPTVSEYVFYRKTRTKEQMRDQRKTIREKRMKEKTSTITRAVANWSKLGRVLNENFRMTRIIVRIFPIQIKWEAEALRKPV